MVVSLWALAPQPGRLSSQPGKVEHRSTPVYALHTCAGLECPGLPLGVQGMCNTAVVVGEAAPPGPGSLA